MPKYFADLNPGFPARGEQRWTVFYRNQKGRLVNLGEGDRKHQFATRRGAENTAARYNAKPGALHEVAP